VQTDSYHTYDLIQTCRSHVVHRRTYWWVCQTYEGVMSNISMSIFISRVTHVWHAHSYVRLDSCMFELVWVMSHIWMSHVTHMNESCYTYEWVMLHIWMSHVTHRNESCRTYEWVMSHICISQITYINKPCYTYEWATSHLWVTHGSVTSHIWTSHVTHMNESCHTYEW